MHCFCNENKYKCGFCDDCDNCIHCKKLKYIRECLGNAYYLSPKEAPWQPNHWKDFLYYETDKELKNIQNLVSDDFNFRIEIKYVKKVGQSIGIIIFDYVLNFNYVTRLSNFFWVSFCRRKIN